MPLRGNTRKLIVLRGRFNFPVVLETQPILPEDIFETFYVEYQHPVFDVVDDEFSFTSNFVQDFLASFDSANVEENDGKLILSAEQTDGYRISPPIFLDDVLEVISTLALFTVTTPANTQARLYYALNYSDTTPPGEDDWIEITHDQPLEGVSAEDNLRRNYLWLKQVLQRDNTTDTVEFVDYDIEVSYYDGDPGIDFPIIPQLTMSTLHGDFLVNFIEWFCDTFNPDISDNYTFSARLDIIPIFKAVPHYHVLVVMDVIAHSVQQETVYVLWGTAYSMPDNITLNLSNNQTAQHPVDDWTEDAVYDNETHGQYAFPGSYTGLPEGVVGDEPAVPDAIVIVHSVIDSIDPIDDIEVPYNTDIGDIILPNSIHLNITSGEKIAVPVTWSDVDYDGTVYGEHIFVSNYDLPAHVLGELLEHTLTVIVRPVIVSVESFADITENFGTPYGETNLPAQAEVTLSDATTRTVDITWNYNPAYHTQNIEGTYDLPENVAGEIIPAQITVIVPGDWLLAQGFFDMEGVWVDNVQFLPEEEE